MSRSRRPRKRKGCAGCYDDGFAKVNRHGLCRSCQAQRNRERATIDELRAQGWHFSLGPLQTVEEDVPGGRSWTVRQTVYAARPLPGFVATLLG